MSPEEKDDIKAALGVALREGTARTEPAAASPAAKEKCYSPDGVAWMVVSPNTAAAFVAKDFHFLGSWGEGKVTPNALSDSIDLLADMVKLGDLSGVEAMFVGQAVALQTMFVSLSQKAASATDRRRHDALLMLALKAQSNARATLAALVDLKHPRAVSFTKQTNVANTQQINNASQQGPAAAIAAPVEPLALPLAQSEPLTPQALPRPAARVRARVEKRGASKKAS